MRAKIILIIAIIMGLLTTFLFMNYMKRYDEVSVANENLVNVVAAKQEIKKNQIIQVDMLEVVQVPKMGLHPQTVMSLSDVAGKYAVADIALGEVLLSSRIKSEKEESEVVAMKVRDGYRAISVGVNFVQSVSNLIEPDDMVDVVWTKPGVADQPATSMQLLEKIRVLAVGRRMVEVNAEHPYEEYSAVTLEIPNDQAVKLINANETGTISLVLHGRTITGENKPKP